VKTRRNDGVARRSPGERRTANIDNLAPLMNGRSLTNNTMSMAINTMIPSSASAAAARGDPA
jgi:hypothetical protein